MVASLYTWSVAADLCSDHLQRHMLNHNSEGNTCERCHAHFKRPDLLARHEERHKQKDEEAGGEGLGIVETRKRLWRDMDGNIVSKRPSFSNRLANPRLPGALSDDQSEGVDGHDQVDNQTCTQNERAHQEKNPMARPEQFPHQLQSEPDSQMFEYTTSTSIPEQSSDMLDFLANSTWGQKTSHINQASGSRGNNRIWDEAFAPDTAASFNAPYTTMSNYSWLFDVNGTNGFEMQIPGQMNNWIPDMNSQTLHSFGQGMMDSSQQPTSSYQQQVLPQQQMMQSSLPMQTFLAQSGYQTTSQPQTTAGPRRNTASNMSSEDHLTASTSPEALSASDCSMASSRTSYSQHSPATKHTYSSSGGRPQTASSSDASTLQSMHPFSPPKNLPRINETAHQRILDIIVQAGTRTPDGMLVSRQHPLLSKESLQDWSDLFWTCFSSSYPLIHMGTFDPSLAEPLLLLSILLLGATYGDKAAHRLAVCIHDILRGQIFAHANFGSEPELWILQTILLVECFGKSRAGQKQHDMSHLFHGLLINLIRRSNCQTVQQPEFCDESMPDLDTQWRASMDVEQRKRLCQMCFLWDVQHAVLFSQSLCMSSFEIRTALPCDPAVWEAETAEEWRSHATREPAPKLFLPILKSYMSPSAPIQSHNLNALSRLLILHGLLSVSWDFARRDQTSLGCGSLIGSDDWRARIGASLDTWQADFAAWSLTITSSLNSTREPHNPNLQADFQRFTTSTLAIYHAAHIILNIEILDLQIYAGAHHIIGRPVSGTDYERSRRKVRDWAQQKPGTGAGTSTACTAVWHAAQLLRDWILSRESWDQNHTFHHPWCLYLATLTCWAFHHGSSDERAVAPGSMGYDAANEDVVSVSMGIYGDTASESVMHDAKAEMNALVSGMTSGVPEGLWRIAGKYSTRGLTTIMAQHLSNVRWAVVHEAMKVLKGLMARQEAR